MFTARTAARLSPRTLLLAVTAGLAALAALFATAAAGGSSHQRPPKPTIVLVHGAFADASGWNDVTRRLQDRGYTVQAPPNPLRGVVADAAYLRTFLSTIDGPIVLVGHSYGGFVITNAATGNPNVKALVYVAAYGPDEGDSIQTMSEQIPGSQLGPQSLTIRPYPGPDGELHPEGYIRSDLFHDIFAGDLPRRQTDTMAVSQRPAAVAVLGEPSGAPAWKSIPSWYIVAGRDNTIGTELERFMAKRMGARTSEVRTSSHVLMMSHPGKTARVIIEAATGSDDG